MSTTEVLAFVGIAAAIILSQLGRHPFTLRRVLIPLLVAGAVTYYYLDQGVATTSGALDFELILAVAGAAFGIVAMLLIRVERDTRTGEVVLHAGITYAVVWVVVFGGRLAFAWAATHVWQHQIMQFSVTHDLTGAVWTDAFVLMAVSMVLVRTLAVGARALLVTRLQTAPEPTQA